MKKVVFVVEGQTEQVFIQKFITQMVALNSPRIVVQKFHGGNLITLTTRGPDEEDATHCIWVINVENDEKTLSYIQDNIDAFKQKEVQGVFGLRDRYTGDSQRAPINPQVIDRHTDLLTAEHGLTIQLTIAIEEIEAWFLSVPSFFLKYNEQLTPYRLQQILGFDLSIIDVEQIPHPAKTIDDVLKAIGLTYKKRLGDAYKIASALDYEQLYLERSQKIPALGKFVDSLNWALN